MPGLVILSGGLDSGAIACLASTLQAVESLIAYKRTALGIRRRRRLFNQLTDQAPTWPPRSVVRTTGSTSHHVLENQQLKDKKYTQEAATWEAMRKHMYVIADALGDALAKQFPAKF